MTNLEFLINSLDLLKLPDEIIIGICYFLEPNETIFFSLTCNSAYLIIHNNPIIWRFYCHKFGFVQFKKDKIWCYDYIANYKKEETKIKFDEIRNNKKLFLNKNQIRKKNSFLPKEEVEAYSIEFGKEDSFLNILEYEWWRKDNEKELKNYRNIIKGRKPFNNWSNLDNDNIKLDISLATELINWRLVFYMNILNEDSNNTFWLRVGNNVDLMIPITSVKIDPKIYKDIDENIFSKIYDLARKIRYLSTLHTCRHFIRLPCPMRIRELLTGGRVGGIITSEPNSQGRYLLELPKELVHLFESNEFLTDNNHKSNKLQLPINIYRKKSSNDEIKISNILEDYSNIKSIEDNGKEQFYKVNSSSIQFVTIANAFLSYASNPNWKTSLTPRSISAFKQVNSSNSTNNKLFIEILEDIHRNQLDKSKSFKFENFQDFYSNTYKNHSPINCTTPCSVINRTCNLEFQNIKQYFQMLCSNSIIFNMFATSITLQESYINSESIYSCWCEYPKSLVGCTWYYNPVKSNIKDIKEINGMVSYTEEPSKKIKFSFFDFKENIEINLRIDYLKIEFENYQNQQKSTKINKHITLAKDNSYLVDLLLSIIKNLSEIFHEKFYPIIILSGLGWKRHNESQNQNENHINSGSIIDSEEIELIKRIYGDKYTKNAESMYGLESHNFDLLGNLTQNLSFVNGELVHVIIKDTEIGDVIEDIKEQFQINKDIIIPISWSSDGQSISQLSFLPYVIEYKYINGNKFENSVEIYESCSEKKKFSDFQSHSSIHNDLIDLKYRFSKCKLITVSRENNRFDFQQQLKKLNKDIQEFNINSIIKNTNEFYKEVVNGRIINDHRSKNFSSIPVFNTITLQEEKNTKSKSENIDLGKKGGQVKVSILNSTEDARQFEFHNERSDLILVGTSFGKVKLIDRYNDLVLGEEGVSISPIIGLSWFNHHPELFVSGSCLIGSISILSIKENPFCQFDQDSDCVKIKNKGKIIQNTLPFIINVESQSKPFPQLSSLSVNPTDDFFLASGFGKSVALYSTYTGSQIKIMPSMHMSHINVVRFSNFHPHIFSTVSFDSSCKLWDLRQKIQGNDSIFKFELPCMAIMSCFSPQNDQRILISGVDNYLRQIDLRYKEIYKNQFGIQSLNDDHSFRRSVYNSNGKCIFTINTKDKYIHVFDSMNYRLKHSFNSGQLNNNFLNEIPDQKDEYKIYFFPNSSNDESFCDNISSSQLPIYELNSLNSIATNDDYYLQSIRGHPIFSNITGALISTNGSNKSKLSLVKFEDNYLFP